MLSVDDCDSAAQQRIYKCHQRVYTNVKRIANLADRDTGDHGVFTERTATHEVK